VFDRTGRPKVAMGEKWTSDQSAQSDANDPTTEVEFGVK